MSPALVLFAAAVVSAEPAADGWMYPENGPSSHGHVSAGKTGDFETFTAVTNERPEKVVLWYADKLGLEDDHGLVEQAKAGYDELENRRLGHYTVVRDTTAETWGAVIRSNLSAEHAHVQIFVRPNNDPSRDLSIAISQTPSGTAVSVIRSKADERR